MLRFAQGMHGEVAMKYLLLVVVFVLGGCASDTGRVDFDTTDVTYHKDNRTGLCFAAVGSQAALALNSSGLGMTQVPCDQIPKSLLK